MIWLEPGPYRSAVEREQVEWEQTVFDTTEYEWTDTRLLYPVAALPFTSEDWIAAGASDGDLEERYRMLEDLVRNHELTGLHADEVVPMLGPLTHGEPSGSGWIYVYPMKPTKGHRTTLLILAFDEAERVRELRFDFDPPWFAPTVAAAGTDG